MLAPDDLRAALVAEAIEWLGTPWKHHAAVKGVGCDCVGLVVGVARAVGLRVPEEQAWRGYRRVPDGRTLVALLAAHLRRVASGAELPGDVALFRIDTAPQHLGLLGHDGLIVHALAPARRVVAHRLDETWERRLLSFWRFPEL